MLQHIRLALLPACLPIVLYGCGSMPPTGSDDPDTGRPAQPTGAPAIKEGLYSGTTTCEFTETQRSIVTDEGGGPLLVTRTFGPSGLPVLDGEEAFRGQSTATESGNFQIAGTCTNIVHSVNGVVIESDAQVEWDCSNTCSFAFDGICDEANLCTLGTDCFDCDPVVLTGFEISSYQVVDEQRIRRIYTLWVSERDAGLLTLSVQCEGVLSR